MKKYISICLSLLALVCKYIMLPQETLRSLAKVLRSSRRCVRSQYFYVHLLIVLHFPKKLCIGSQNVAFSHKNAFLSPTLYFKSRNIASLAKLLRLHAKVLQSPKKLCNALTTSLCSPNKLCIRSQHFFNI